MPAAQRRLERINRLVARPFYLIGRNDTLH